MPSFGSQTISTIVEDNWNFKEENHLLPSFLAKSLPSRDSAFKKNYFVPFFSNFLSPTYCIKTHINWKKMKKTIFINKFLLLDTDTPETWHYGLITI